MNDYKSMLDLAYEIEGLLTLQISRGEAAAPQIASLLTDKISRLADMAGATPSPACDNSGDDDIAIVEAVLTEEQEDADVSAPVVHISEVAPHICDLPTDPHISPNSRNEFADPDDAEATSRVKAPARSAEPEPTWEDAGTVAPISLDEKIARDSVSDIHTAFSINDKFRFRRELFGNSNQDYNEALDVIAAMSTFDEAEDYFYNDLCWDPESDEVKAFMEIVARYFAS